MNSTSRTTLRALAIDGQRYLHIPNYVMPPEVQDLYNATVLNLLVSLPGNDKGPELFVPSWLRCRKGNPVHINLDAPPTLAKHGWKKACWDIIGGWSERYSTAALLNTIDKFFRGYPYAP